MVLQVSTSGLLSIMGALVVEKVDFGSSGLLRRAQTAQLGLSSFLKQRKHLRLAGLAGAAGGRCEGQPVGRMCIPARLSVLPLT